MALTISTGFVVDDAIVVIENITRYLEQGMQPFAAALQGAQEIGFTVCHHQRFADSRLYPVLLMGGIVGRLFREFAVTLSVAIAISMVVSLTTTPMMCAHLLKEHREARVALSRPASAVFNWIVEPYGRTLDWVLRHPAITLVVLLATIGAECLPVHSRAQGIFPAAGQRALAGAPFMADQDTSFQAMDKILLRMVEHRPGGPGGGHGHRIHRRQRRQRTPTRRACSSRSSRWRSARSRCRPDHRAAASQAGRACRGATLFLQASQDVRVGGRRAARSINSPCGATTCTILTRMAPHMLASCEDSA